MVTQLVACYFVMWLHVFYAGWWWLVLGVVNSVDIVYLCCVMVILVYVNGCCLYVTVAYCLFLVWVFVVGLFAVWLLFYLYFGLDEFEVGCVLFVCIVCHLVGLWCFVWMFVVGGGCCCYCVLLYCWFGVVC